MILPLLNSCFDRPTILQFVRLSDVAVAGIVRQGHTLLFDDAMHSGNSSKGYCWSTVTLRSELERA